MKTYTFLFLLLIAFSGLAQQKQDPDIYLNSVKIDLNKVYVNGNSIDSIRVEKKTVNGAVYILTNDRKFTSITLADIVKKYTDIKQIDNSILFRIKGKVIEDTTGVKIDDSYFVYVEVKDLSGVKYLKNSFREMKIVSIDLENSERKPSIMLRGNEFDLLKDRKSRTP
jgi:hypothetical protein